MKSLQQRLLRDDQMILMAKNEDTRDLARQAKVTASAAARESKPENVISGIAWDEKGATANRWIAAMDTGPVWLKLEWNAPVEISEIQITHDTGLHRTVTMTAQQSVIDKMIFGPQPESIREYAITGIMPDGTEKELAKVSSNCQRLRRHRFETIRVKAIRIDIQRANGPEARIYEVRAWS
jgi:hypothetical protein